MSKGKELAKNTGILFIGKISTQFVSFLLLPLYTAKLSTEAYGTLDLYTTVANILIPILSLQLEQGIFRFLLTQEETEDKIFSSVSFFLLVSSALLALVYIPLSKAVSIEYAGLVLTYYIALLFSTVMQQIPRGYGNYTQFTLISFLSSTVSIVFTVIFICCFNRGIEGVLIARIISSLVVIIFIFIKSKIYSKLRITSISWPCLKSLLKYSIPLVFNQLASWVVNYSDRIIIISFLGIATNGIYAVANRFFSLITSMLNIYNMAWTESVTKSLSDYDRVAYHNKILSLTMNLFLLVATCVTAGIGILFNYFIDPSYDSAYFQIPILVYAAVFSGLSANIGSVYIAYKKTKDISTTTFFSAVINAAVHLFLIKRIGLYAASFSTLISFVSMFYYRIYRIRTIEKLDYNIKAIVKQLPFIIITLFAYYSRNQLYQIIVAIILCVYAVWFVLSQKIIKEQILVIIGKLKRR